MNKAQNQSKKSSHKINPFVNLFWLTLFMLPLFAFMWLGHVGVPWGAIGLSPADIYSAVQQYSPMLDQAVTSYIAKSISWALNAGFISGAFLSAVFFAIYFLLFSFAPFFQNTGHDEDEQSTASLPLR